MAQTFKTNRLLLSGQDVNNVFYPLTSNPSSYLTGFNSGLYALNSNTGNFVTTSQTGIFALATNLTTTGNTLQIAVNSLNTFTGNSVNLYYPRTTNPSGFILPSQTGIFVTTSQTGSFGGSVNTGQLTGAFYPLNSNPKNYFNTGSSILFSGDGNFNIGTSSSNRPQIIYASSTVNANSFQFQNQGVIYSTANGVINLTNNSANDFGRLMFGGPTNAFPSIKRFGAGLDLRVADDTDFTDLRLRNLTTSSSINVSGNIYINGNSVMTGFNSGLYTLNANTGSFITTSQTGAFGGNTPNPWSFLTCSSTTNWNANPSYSEDRKILLLTGNTTLSISGLYNGWGGTLETIQSGISTTGYNLTLPVGTKVINGGSGVAVLTYISGAIDIIGFEYDGINLMCAIGNNFI